MGGDLAIRQGPWKLIFLKNGGRELYNLQNDLSETRDQAAAQPDVVQRLTKLMQTIHRQRPEHAGRRTKERRRDSAGRQERKSKGEERREGQGTRERRGSQRPGPDVRLIRPTSACGPPGNNRSGARKIVTVGPGRAKSHGCPIRSGCLLSSGRPDRMIGDNPISSPEPLSCDGLLSFVDCHTALRTTRRFRRRLLGRGRREPAARQAGRRHADRRGGPARGTAEPLVSPSGTAVGRGAGRRQRPAGRNGLRRHRARAVATQRRHALGAAGRTIRTIPRPWPRCPRPVAWSSPESIARPTR